MSTWRDRYPFISTQKDPPLPIYIRDLIIFKVVIFYDLERYLYVVSHLYIIYVRYVFEMYWTCVLDMYISWVHVSWVHVYWIYICWVYVYMLSVYRLSYLSTFSHTPPKIGSPIPPMRLGGFIVSLKSITPW